jgi:hypothetical protein
VAKIIARGYFMVVLLNKSTIGANIKKLVNQWHHTH